MALEDLTLSILQEEGFARIPDLAIRLKTSESTVRRVLTRLDQQGKVNRVHGGAVLTGRQVVQPGVRAFDELKQVALEEKTAAARRAASLVSDGDTLFIAGGSTCTQMPQFLLNRSLQVVTNSLAVAQQFEDSPATEVLVVGGYLFPRHRLLTGPLALTALGELHFTWAFVSAAAFNTSELTDWNVMIAEVNREALARAGRRVALLDSTKFNRQHLARVCPVSELDYLVCGSLAAATRENIEAQGVRCLEAETDPAGAGTRTAGRGWSRGNGPRHRGPLSTAAPELPGTAAQSS